MSQFSIECPACGKYVQASTGFFAKKKIVCTCGYIINVKTDKLAARKCNHCGNNVIFDQSKADAARCPVCHENINTLTDNQKMESFTCEQCGINLETTKGGDITYECPVCGFINIIQERLMAKKIKEEGIASIIKYEGDNSTFIWKHPIEDFNYGSQLIVHESQEAIFFKDGQALDLFGPGRYTLDTQQIPLLEKIYSLPTDTQSTFHTEVYFINKTVQMAIKWGTPERVRFIDPLTGTPLTLGVSGEMNMQVSDSRKLLLKLVGTMKGISWKDGLWKDGLGFSKSLQSSFRPLISNAVKTSLPTVIKNEAIDLLEIDEKLDIVSNNLKEKIVPEFEDFGLTIPNFYVTNIDLPEADPNFEKIRELHTITLQTRIYQSKATIEAAHREAELQRQTTQNEIAKMEAERKIIDAQVQAQAKRMDGLTEAEIMKAKGYTQRDILQADVQKAYAEGIGNMGPDTITGGAGGSGIMGEMMNIGMGMAAMNVMAPQFNNMMQGLVNIGQTPVTNQSVDNVNAGIPNMVQSEMSSLAGDTWDCSCGNKGIVGNFCNNCGARKPEEVNEDTWDCSCGNKGIVGNFCNNCGARKSEAVKVDTWDCSCGNKGIVGNFCNNCGAKRGELV